MNKSIGSGSRREVTLGREEEGMLIDCVRYRVCLGGWEGSENVDTISGHSA